MTARRGPGQEARTRERERARARAKQRERERERDRFTCYTPSHMSISAHAIISPSSSLQHCSSRWRRRRQRHQPSFYPAERQSPRAERLGCSEFLVPSSPSCPLSAEDEVRTRREGGVGGDTRVRKNAHAYIEHGHDVHTHTRELLARARTHTRVHTCARLNTHSDEHTLS